MNLVAQSKCFTLEKILQETNNLITTKMLIVAYLSNSNGMATWCWEAAHALHEANYPVLLVCSNDVKLPGSPTCKILRFDASSEEPEKKRNILARTAGEFERLSPKSTGFISQLHKHLQDQNIKPDAYFISQSNLQDPRVAVPQHIVGWAYPTSLTAYLLKVGKATAWKVSLQSFRTALDYIGWWGRDWRAYRSATSVLAVSNRLASELVAQGIRATTVHPGTAIAQEQLKEHNTVPRRLLIAAFDLEDPRKRIKWMIDALKSDPQKNYSLTVVGYASETFKHWASGDSLPIHFMGHMTRDQLQTLMADHDIFLFGSCLDDWGYVLVEAMSKGLAIVAPDISPFDEIIGDAGLTYSVSSSREFREKVSVLLNSDLLCLRKAALERARHLFSRQAFSQSLTANLPVSQRSKNKI